MIVGVFLESGITFGVGAWLRARSARLSDWSNEGKLKTLVSVENLNWRTQRRPIPIWKVVRPPTNCC